MIGTTHLHNNWFKASLQVLGWLLFHPSAWQHYISQIDKTLAADFTFNDIPPNCQRHPDLRRLRLITYLILPILVGLLIGVILIMINLVPWFFISGNNIFVQNSMGNLTTNFPEHFFADLIFGVSYGLLVCLVGSLLSSYTISVPFAIVASVLGGTATGILIGMGPQFDAWAIILGIFAISVAGSVTTYWHCKQNKCSVIGSVVIGTFFSISSGVVGIIILAIVLVVGAGAGILLAQWFELNEFQNHLIQIIGMAVTVGLFLGYYLKRNWRDTFKWGFLLGCLMSVLVVLTLYVVEPMQDHSWPKRLVSGITGGTINATAFVVLFAVPYLLARRFANIWAGVIAGVLGSGGIYLGILLTGEEYSMTWLLWGGLSFAFGLAQNCWLPILSYPFELAWNLLNSRSQKNHPERTVNLLPWHSAFWNEHQHLKLKGLERLLVRVYEHDPKLGQQAILQLSNTPQRWAVQATQIEVNTQRLEKCHTIHNIAQVHTTLVVNEDLADMTGGWLHNFQKNSQDVEAALKENNYQQPITFDRIINRLEGMLTLAGGKQPTEVRRFRDIAKTWLHLLTEYANQIKQVQEIPNPYIFGPPLENGQDIFVPRPNVNTRIKRLLGDRGSPPLLLYGQRRTGKTSLLKNLHQQLPADFVMLFVDCQGALSAAQNQISFFYNLGRAIIKAANKHYPELKLPPLSEEMVRSDPATRFDEWLDQVEAAMGEKTLLLTLDEFVTLDNAFNDGRLDVATILGMFRNIIQHRSHFRLLLSGTHTFQELQHWASYLINVQKVHLNYLTADEAELLIEHPVEQFPLRYTAEATRRVMSLTHNQPAFVQLLCGEIVQIKDGQTVDKRLYVQVADVEAAIPAAFEHGGFVFTDIEQNQIDDHGRAILHLMASQGEGAIMSHEELATQLSDTNLEKTIALLLQREIIETVEEGYRFQVELVRRWFNEK